MKRIIAILAAAVMTLAAEAKQTALWTGTCRNITYGLDGLLKVFVEEDAGKVKGFISISGWLIGSGKLNGTKTGNDIKFTSDGVYGLVIDWEGVISDKKLTGEYYCRPNAATKTGKQVGEFKLELADVQKDGLPENETSFRKLFMLATEVNLNSPVKLDDGTTALGAEALFRAVHPVGRGVSVQVTDVDIDWKDGSARRDVADVRRYVLDYTLYWHGVLQATGWTKLRMAYNVNLGRVTENTIIKSTGTTKEQADNIAFGIGFLLGKAAVESMLDGR